GREILAGMLHRVLLYAPDPEVLRWMEGELAAEPYYLQIARSPREIVRALIDDPPPRPQILIADVDALTARDVLGIHSIRDRGWFGSVIAVGALSIELRTSLAVETVVARLARGALREAVTAIGLHRATTKQPKLARG